MSHSNTTEALDLYAKVEDLLEIKEVAAPRLYAHYLLALQGIEFDSMLDLGCGSGDFLINMQEVFSDVDMMGIDLSPEMVSRAAAQGINAKCIDISDLDATFDVVTATFDVVNYLDNDKISDFLAAIHARLNNNGYFICDINTMYGFSEVAVGSFITQNSDSFLAIDSYYEDDVYNAEFTLFEKDGDLYNKMQEQMFQYYYKPKEIEKISGMELVSIEDVSLYGEISDKHFLLFQKTDRNKQGGKS